jgi:hypothetical protein
LIREQGRHLRLKPGELFLRSAPLFVSPIALPPQILDHRILVGETRPQFSHCITVAYCRIGRCICNRWINPMQFGGLNEPASGHWVARRRHSASLDGTVDR